MKKLELNADLIEKDNCLLCNSKCDDTYNNPSMLKLIISRRCRLLLMQVRDKINYYNEGKWEKREASWNKNAKKKCRHQKLQRERKFENFCYVIIIKSSFSLLMLVLPSSLPLLCVVGVNCEVGLVEDEMIFVCCLCDWDCVTVWRNRESVSGVWCQSR